ncbi:MAG: chemotaxis protein [Desulfatitalea sp. BRH_c12]|nr:MAG: chemotaxis protein [Desulfatitalea sp. BRH_c12]
MKINLKSISSKLLVGGILAVLLPLITVGYFSYVKAEQALLNITMTQAEGIAADLSLLTRDVLAAEIQLANVIAGQKQVVNMLNAIEQFGMDGVDVYASDIFLDLKQQFANMSGRYLGIFIAGGNGDLITGILDDGTEYKGSNIFSRDYFQSVRTHGKAVLSDIVISKSTGKPISVACAPVKSISGNFVGAVGVVLHANFFTEVIAGRKIGQTGYGYMIDKNGLILAHPVPSNVLQLDVTSIPEMKAINTEMMAGKTGVRAYHYKGKDKLAGYAPVGINGWSIAATQDHDEFFAASVGIRNATIIVALGAGLAVTLIVLFAARRIVRPINEAVAGLKDIAQGEGDLTMRLQVSSKDEVGELARWFNLFIEKLQGIIGQISGSVDTLSSSSTELSAISEQMSQAARNTSGKCNTVAAASEEMSTNMNTVATAMEQSATNMQVVATAAEEMSATIGEIAVNSEKARHISDQAAVKAADTSAKVTELGHAAQAIGKVVEAITDISEQVNLLALNATIEAARAGEAGKGFAVVANEIKELAKQTAAATQDIKTRIGDIQGSTTVTIGQIDQITKVIKEVNDVVAGIAAAVEEQSTATSEIAINVAQTAEGIQEVNSNVGQSSIVAADISKNISDVNVSANEMTNSSSQVNISAQDLSKLAEQLRGMVNKFKI